MTEVTITIIIGDKEALGAPVKLNKENNWKHVFSNLKAKKQKEKISVYVKK